VRAAADQGKEGPVRPARAAGPGAGRVAVGAGRARAVRGPGAAVRTPTCVEEAGADRPSMGEVVSEIERIIKAAGVGTAAPAPWSATQAGHRATRTAATVPSTTAPVLRCRRGGWSPH